MNHEPFEVRLRLAVERSGLAQKDIAQAAGFHVSWISALINGYRKPSLDGLSKLLTALPDVDARWLVCGDGKEPDRVTVSVAEHERRIASLERAIYKGETTKTIMLNGSVRKVTSDELSYSDVMAMIGRKRSAIMSVLWSAVNGSGAVVYGESFPVSDGMIINAYAADNG